MHGAALHMACSGGQEDIVKLLLEKGAEVNTAFEDDGTPLSSLCYMDAWEDVAKAPEKIEAIARLLIESSADINKAGGKHGYPINRASHFQPARFVKFLLGQGATVDVKDEMGRCPVLFAAVPGIDNLRAILEAGGDAEACDGLQRTAVHWAAMGGHAEAFKLLLSSLPSAAVDAPDNDGWTPLCWAAYGVDPWRSNRTSERFDQAKTIRTLLEYGANRFIVAEGPVRRWTPVKIARYCRASDTVIALLEKGIDYIGPVTPETEGFVSTGARDGGSGWCVCCVSVSRSLLASYLGRWTITDWKTCLSHLRHAGVLDTSAQCVLISGYVRNATRAERLSMPIMSLRELAMSLSRRRRRRVKVIRVHRRIRARRMMIPSRTMKNEFRVVRGEVLGGMWDRGELWRLEALRWI